MTKRWQSSRERVNRMAHTAIKASCARCAHGMWEEWPGGRIALRCGYAPEPGDAGRAGGALMTEPETVYGRTVRIVPAVHKGCADGPPPGWCRGFFTEKNDK